jgi:cytoskeletal protein CcmA (bactofilin family)
MSAAPSFGLDPGSGKAIIGKSVTVKGEIRSHEDLIIEGDVEGTVEMVEHRLTIAPDGNVRANVKARDIDVLGSIHGKAEAVDKVYVRKNANFVGDIHAGSIVVEDGGYLKGNIDLSRQPASKGHVNGIASVHSSKPETIRVA